jgi:Scaffold domain
VGVSLLHGIVDSARNEDLRWPDFTPYKTEFAKLYEMNSYSLVWVESGRVRSQGLAVIDLLENADGKGLDPKITTVPDGRAASSSCVRLHPSKT